MGFASYRKASKFFEYLATWLTWIAVAQSRTSFHRPMSTGYRSGISGSDHLLYQTLVALHPSYCILFWQLGC